jgi:Isochorismatase family
MTKIPLGPSPQNEWHVSDDEADLVRRRWSPTAEPQRVRIDLRRTASIVVDMQNDFCAAGGWLDHIGVDIAPARRPIAPLQRILPELRRKRVPVIWLNWGNRPDRLNLSPSLLHVYKPDGRGAGSATRCRRAAPRFWRRAAGQPTSSTSCARRAATSASTSTG